MDERLRPYRRKAALMGQTSPPGLGHEVALRVVGDSVADIGCGSGVLGYLLRAAWEFTEAWEREGVAAPERLVGVDWSPATLDALTACNPFDELHLASSTGVPLPDAYVDTAVSMENLEHLLPGEVGPALAELARIAHRRIVITTPAPWGVVNVPWLEAELDEARRDEVPMGHTEFVDLVGRLHKSTVTPEQMRAAGFESGVTRLGAPSVTDTGAIIYVADPQQVRVDRLGEVTGIGWSAYPSDDGRDDWREAYVEALALSRGMGAPTRPPAGVRVSHLLRHARAAVRLP